MSENNLKNIAENAENLDLNDLIQIKEEGKQLDNPIAYLQENKYLARIEMVHMDSFDEIQSVNELEINKKLMLSSKRNKLIIDFDRIPIELDMNLVGFLALSTTIFTHN